MLRPIKPQRHGGRGEIARQGADGTPDYNDVMPRKASEVDQIMDSLFAAFKRGPWWAGLIVIPIAYILFYFAIPLIAGLVSAGDDSPVKIGEMIAGVCRMIAPFIALAVALLWGVALVHKLRDNQRVDRQRGIDTIRELSWCEFEQLLATAFERQGYTVIDTGLNNAPGSPDGGVDLILERDDKRYLVQCKQWKARKVGVSIARELYGLVASEHADGGILITSGRYTRDAHQFAEKLPLKLIDGPKLEALIQGVQRKPAASRTPRPRNTKPAPAATVQSVPTCPTCQSPMIHRTAKRGAKAGQAFWGCPQFPNCRGTRSM